MAADATADRSALARQRLEAVLDCVLPPEAATARRIILGAVSDYTAAMIELCARPPALYWGPVRGSEDGSGAA